MNKRMLVSFVIVLILFSLLGCTTNNQEATEGSTEIPSTQTSTTIPNTQTATTTVTASATVEPTLFNTSTVTPMVFTATPTPMVNYRLPGINIGPYLSSDPNLGASVSEDELRTLIARIAPYTYSIRTFGCGGGLNKAGTIAHELGLTIAAGAWLGPDIIANESEIQCLIEMAKSGDVDIAVIGNEVLLRGDLDEEELLGYINQFKEEVPEIPVTTAESWRKILEMPNLVSAVDIVAVNMYPFWENIPVDEAAGTLEDWFQELRVFVNEVSPGKEILITETGWPSCGTNGSPASENFYFGSFTSFARAYGLTFYWFEAYDEPWKVAYEGEVGGCWGLWDTSGNMKDGMDVVFSGVVGGIATPELEISNSSDMWNSGVIEGYAWHVIPSVNNVVTYIFVPDTGGWWIKPSFDFPLTEIEETGVWISTIYTGGIDNTATEVAVFIIPEGYSPPLAAGWTELPKELYDHSVASTLLLRD